MIHIDGASRGNPGNAGIGIVIRDRATGEILLKKGEFMGTQTNNAAEYLALIRALEHALGMGASSVTIRSDSQLLVRQMQGKYRVRTPSIGVFHRWASELASYVDELAFEEIPRENNKEADRLASEAAVRGW